MKRTMILLLVLLVTFSFVQVDDDCLDGAQAWYDTADFAQIVNSDVLDLLRASNRRADWERLEFSFRINGDVAERLDHPQCVEYAVQSFKDAMYTFADYAVARAQGNEPGIAVTMATATQRLGEMRGYLAALGVEVDIREDVTLYWK
jgi:hypothetical protein